MAPFQMVGLMNERGISNSVKHLQGNVFPKIVNGYKQKNYFSKNLHHNVRIGSGYTSVNMTFHLTFFRRTWFMESWSYFSRFYLKKNHNFEYKRWSPSWRPANCQLYWKETPTNFSVHIIPKVFVSEKNLKKRELTERLSLL